MLKRGKVFLFLTLGLLLAATGAVRAESGVSMHGAPKYGPDFQALAYVNPDAPKGGTLRLAMTGSFDSVNPYSVRGNRATGATLTGESLLGRTWDEPFSLYGLIAESVTMPDDRSWVEFRLRPEARWNDGTPITVADVLFSWQALRDHGRPNHRTYYSKVLRAEETAPRTVRFTFAGGNAGGDREMPLIMGLMPLLQKSWWETRDVSAPTLEIPPTSGPYRLTEVDPGRRLVYVRDPDYWGQHLPLNRGQWNFDRITYDYYRDDAVALEAFKAGAYDLRREQDPVKWLSGYAGFDGVREEIPHGRPEPIRGFVFNTRRPLFADVRVREALAEALDFDWMNRTLFGNIYHRATSTFPNSELAADAGEQPGQASPMRDRYRRALALLTQAGWTTKNGILQKDGQPFTFEILLVSPPDTKVALAFARSLTRLGITAKVRMVDSAQYQTRMTDFDFDMTINFWSSTLSPGNEQLFYWGSQAAAQPGSRNYAGVNSPTVDALANSLATATTRNDLVTRARDLDRALMAGHYIIPLYYLGRDLAAYRPPLRRPAVTPVYGILPEQTWWREPSTP